MVGDGVGESEEKRGLSERLLAARKWRGLTQDEAGREIGVSRNTISRIEHGYMAHESTRARVRRWVVEQEAARAAAEAARAMAVRRRLAASLAERCSELWKRELKCGRARAAGRGRRSASARCCGSPRPSGS
jgi:DNA-binding XRE family transcriptional regulator